MTKNQNYLYVEVGRKIPYYLKTSIKFSRHFNPNAKIYYISDVLLSKRIIKKYDLNYVYFDKQPYRLIEEKVKKLFPEKSVHRRKYWLNSLLRLFAIKDFIENAKVLKFIHFESDSLPMLTNIEYEQLINKGNFNLTCFDLNDSCVPTLIVIVDSNSYLNFIDLIESYIVQGLHTPDWYWNDIHSINLGKKMGFFQSLPVYPSLNICDMELKNNLVFDTAVYGRYILGDDPRNNKFIIKTGKLENKYKNLISPQKLKWKIIDDKSLKFEIEGSEWKVGVLHNYAKRKINIINSKSLIWKRLIREANFESKRIIGFSTRLFFKTLIDFAYKLIWKI